MRHHQGVAWDQAKKGVRFVMSSLRAFHPCVALTLGRPPASAARNCNEFSLARSIGFRHASCNELRLHLGSQPNHFILGPSQKRSTICYVLVACNPPVRGAYTRIVAYFTRVVRFEKVAWLELRESLSFTWKSSLFKKTRCVIIRVWLGPKPKQEYDLLCPRCVESTRAWRLHPDCSVFHQSG